MIENVNEIKYPVIIKAWGASYYLYESCKSAHKLDSEGSLYKESLPINKHDTIRTKEFLQGKYVRVKCPEEMDYIRKLCGNAGMSEMLLTGDDFVVFNTTNAYSFYEDVEQDWLQDYEELILPFPESIYQKESSEKEEYLATEPLSQDFSHLEGDSLAESLHSLSERYTLFYSYYPSEVDSSDKSAASRSYFLVDYKEVSYKVDSVAKVGDLEKMIMIERGLCYEE